MGLCNLVEYTFTRHLLPLHIGQNVNFLSFSFIPYLHCPFFQSMLLQNFVTYLTASHPRETYLLPSITYVIKKFPAVKECADLLSSIQNLLFFILLRAIVIQFISSCSVFEDPF